MLVVFGGALAVATRLLQLRARGCGPVRSAHGHHGTLSAQRAGLG